MKKKKLKKHSIMTTTKQFDDFKRHVLKWIDFFGLKEWKIFFYQRNILDHNGNGGHFAGLNWDVVHHACSFFFALELDEDDFKMLEIERHAFHEVCHLLLANLHETAMRRYTTLEDIEKSTEYIIRTLENTLFLQSKKKRKKSK